MKLHLVAILTLVALLVVAGCTSGTESPETEAPTTTDVEAPSVEEIEEDLDTSDLDALEDDLDLLDI